MDRESVRKIHEKANIETKNKKKIFSIWSNVVRVTWVFFLIASLMGFLVFFVGSDMVSRVVGVVWVRYFWLIPVSWLFFLVSFVFATLDLILDLGEDHY